MNQVNNIIERLEQHNYLNDSRLLENEINKYLHKQYGQSRIRQELKRKGFLDTDIGHALDNIDVDWYTMAQELKNWRCGGKF